MSDYNLTLLEACELLKKSKKTLSRYIRQGKLKAETIKSQKGTLEYRFSKKEIEGLKAKEGQGGQPIRRAITAMIQRRPDREDKTGQRGQTRQDTRQDSEIVKLLKDTTQVLKGQLKEKDVQIKSLSKKIDGLIERGRETNILLKGFQGRLLMLEAPKEYKEYIRADREDKTGYKAPYASASQNIGNYSTGGLTRIIKRFFKWKT
jgi:hypothetical protein